MVSSRESSWVTGDQLGKMRGVEDEDIERLPAGRQRRDQPGDSVGLGQIDRGDRGAAAGFEDCVLDRFELLRVARGQDDMRALRRQRQGGRRADAAARAGDQRELAGERLSFNRFGRHAAFPTASRLSCAGTSRSARSVSQVG